MAIRTRILIIWSLLTIGVSAPLFAEEIDITVPITSGSVSFYPSHGTGAGPLYLSGDGFSFMAAPGLGATSPGCCLTPGATASIRAVWSGDDLRGGAVYNGETFPYSFLSGSQSVTFLGAFTVPDFNGSTSITVSAPITLNGFFGAYDTTKTDRLNATLVGSGIGTISLGWLSFGQWEPRFGTIQMSATGDAVPEPSSVLLVCLSLGVYAAITFRRRALL